MKSIVSARIDRQVFVAFLLILMLLLGASALVAAEKTVKGAVEKPAAVVPAAGKESVSPASAEGQNLEKLLFTLNETLEENRKIRQNMRDLQAAFEKVTVEKSDLTNQMRKVEQFTIQRTRDSNKAIEDLKGQLETSQKEIQKFQTESEQAAENRKKAEAELAKLNEQNTKLQELLKGAILESERAEILGRMKKNDEQVQKAVTLLSGMDVENVELRDQLVRSYFELGNICYDLGRYDEAILQFQRALRWNPNHAWAHHNLAIVYDYHINDSKKARDEYQAYLNLKPAGEEAGKVRVRLWELKQLVRIEPDRPIREDFDMMQKEQRGKV
ncbi:MAG TPA: tetratricopeptide repeat protein [Candidatus Omnitrophota bacterium]|nr:tetratricopeptide repeat protein [Candidatus Omnitrophota bacterium]